MVDADPEAASPWPATVYVPGMALSEAVAAHGPWPPGPVLTLGSAPAEALGAIHTAGVVHRDLKPSNILLAHDGPRVIDFVGAGAYAAPPPAHGWLPEPVARTVQLHAPTAQSTNARPSTALPPSGVTRRRALFGLAGIGYGAWRLDDDSKEAAPAPRQSPTVPQRPGTPRWTSTVAVGDGRDDANGTLAVANGTVCFPAAGQLRTGPLLSGPTAYVSDAAGALYARAV
ncbi:protein kinase domain-containing protein [Streptomyces scopuliridis]|uniref:protein kinase domain-containing protein n=1 Tax=Streptomyces scopuliridis TaxID=452529 RepID=UPI003F5435AB